MAKQGSIQPFQSSMPEMGSHRSWTPKKRISSSANQKLGMDTQISDRKIAVESFQVWVWLAA